MNPLAPRFASVSRPISSAIFGSLEAGRKREQRKNDVQKQIQGAWRTISPNSASPDSLSQHAIGCYELLSSLIGSPMHPHVLDMLTAKVRADDEMFYLY